MSERLLLGCYIMCFFHWEHGLMSARVDSDEQWWWEAKRCYEAQIEESEKADSRRELNPGALAAHLACAASALQPNNHQPPQSLMCTAQVVLKCLSCTPGSHSACAVRTPLGVNQKILSIRREPMLSGFSQSKCLELLPHDGIKRIQMLWGENREKTGSRRELNPEHLACAPGLGSKGSLLMERIFQSPPNGVLTAHAEWLLGVRLRHFMTVPPVQYI